MSLFQTSVVKKYLNELSPELIDKKYTEFQAYFGNPEIQQNIRESKEEEYQSGFVSALFVNILGYTLKPEPNYDFVLEKKNIDDSKKADGAILKDNEVIAVIELKSTQTTDLDTVETQAFGYKNHNPKCQYIITSNFEKIRLYIQNAIDHLEFDLFNLSRENFALLWLCFLKDNILQDIPLKIKEASVLQEENVTKKLYNDYSNFRKDIFNNIVKNNPEYDKLVLFKKTQKLLDRFLFIFFAEDRLLVPPNSINQITEKWKDDVDFGDVKPLYSIFKQYFHVLNVGRPKSGKRQEIFPYNGGLFLNDEILDKIKIDDDILYKHTLKLSTYDFETEVDVNILGHIFEHSLGEIENVQAEIKGEEVDKQKTRRKKDGIFYTPKYITKYIVENTVGKLCEEKRAELEIIDEEYAKGRKNRKKDIVRALDDKLTAYRDWLLNITILDPACGSGAFLNQALEFLIQEHKKIDELKFQLLGGSIVFPDVEAKILEKNIYGVDLNEESVEIAKLSLWLRTAQKGRKLTTLSNHIKCGNSLIDDPEVAGEKAFNWQNEFPEVFANGGFDVVIGNPPYVNMNTFPKKIHLYFEKAYNLIHTGYNDLMYYFLFKGISLLKNTGFFSVITSNYFIGNDYAKNLRLFLTNHLTKIINFENIHVFSDANVHTAILLAESKPKQKEVQFYTYLKKETLNELVINDIDFKLATINRKELGENWIIANESNQKLLSKIASNNILLGSISEIAKGSESGKNEIFTVTDEIIKRYNLEIEIIRKCVKNSNISSYYISFDDNYLIYTDNTFSEEKYPNTFRYLQEHKDSLLERRGPRTGEYEWWRLHRPSIKKVFDSKEKILVPYRANKNRFGYDCHQYFNNGGDIRAIRITNEKFKTKYIIGLLNSSLLDWYYGFIGKPKGNAREYFNKPLSQIPIPEIALESQNNIIGKVDSMLELIPDLKNKKMNFEKYLISNYSFQQLNKKLQNWHELDFGEFISELNKTIKKGNGNRLTKMDEMEWMEVFAYKKEEILKIKYEIDKTNQEIDQIVYELYGLTENEIKIIEKTL